MKIDIDVFNTASIDKAIERLRNYALNLKNVTDIIVDELTNLGAKIARANITSLGVNSLTGEIASCIRIEKQGKGIGCIIADSKHAVFVEFGTGPVGDKNQHPLSSERGVRYAAYDWWYPTIPEDPNPSKYETADGQLKAHTSGQPAHPFMYNTAQELRNQLIAILGRVLKENDN